ncbi:nodulation protein NolW [Mesorhizobium sp. VK23B]|uniref:Nodulation protein NolW n=2 Tax=Mesorhizobium TaxID=68287 RepID=A0ABU4YPM1_9HYPH|nr:MULTISPECIES: nodulation protein NolW [unclassified Mesorhizobium]MDX8461287.1 nodulation protein NolW [Mesorhizobium sp. VK2D]MDX8469903.1 nodulation protein NolW [Mesorhizobium sp. VK23B]MDX8476242.1 nodulation protein NolW [Mesorhizobium sp. VK23A]MDX8488897.1 nodulation protein NolW [Mesorhizobium sp. VK2B]
MPGKLIQSTILHIGMRVLFLGVLLSTGIHATLAAPLSLPSTPYRYTVLDQDLSAALREFGNNLNVDVDVSSEVKGRIRGRMPSMSPRAFLDRLTDLYDLQWYYDGLVLHVTAAKEAQTRMLVLTSVRFEVFKAALDELGISDERYVVRPAPGKGLVMVSGPPRFIVLVEQTYNGLVAEAQARPHDTGTPPKETELMLFRGSSTVVVRDGRPEGPFSSEVPHQDSVVREPAQSQR